MSKINLRVRDRKQVKNIKLVSSKSYFNIILKECVK